MMDSDFARVSCYTWEQKKRKAMECLFFREEIMRNLIALLAVGVVVVLAFAALSPAATRTTVWTAALSSGQEVPAQVERLPAADLKELPLSSPH